MKVLQAVEVVEAVAAVVVPGEDPAAEVAGEAVGEVVAAVVPQAAMPEAAEIHR